MSLRFGRTRENSSEQSGDEIFEDGGLAAWFVLFLRWQRLAMNAG